MFETLKRVQLAKTDLVEMVFATQLVACCRPDLAGPRFYDAQGQARTFQIANCTAREEVGRLLSRSDRMYQPPSLEQQAVAPLLRSHEDPSVRIGMSADAVVEGVEQKQETPFRRVVMKPMVTLMVVEQAI